MEQRTFSMDPALLYTVIDSQAGTLEKALLEGVMNSIDAGSRKVSVELTATNFTITDNGRGFKTREEILKWFETFGTPHREGDALYGRFRIGRGQLMSFASTVWQTGSFRMAVDIRKSGLGYELSEQTPRVKGCTVIGQLYNTLSEETKRETEEGFRRLVAFAPIPVELNGKLVSCRPEKAKWDFEDDSCWLRLDADARELLVYNQGVLVKGMPGYRYGTGGVVVSKLPLKLNSARNDILEYACPNWYTTRDSIERGVVSRLSTRKQLTDDQRGYLARKILAGSDLATVGRSAKIFTDVQGKHIALADLFAGHTLAVESSARPQLSRALHDSGRAIVLSRKSLDRAGATSLAELFDKLSELPEARDARLVQLDIDGLPSHMAGPKDREVPSSSLYAKERAALKALEAANEVLASWLDARGTSDVKRELRVGVRAGAVAWTDGSQYLYVHRKYLKELDRGIAGASYWFHVLVHEYCHDSDDTETHSHGEVFYGKYHEWAGAPDFPLVRGSFELQRAYITALRQYKIPAGRLLSRQLKGNDL